MRYALFLTLALSVYEVAAHCKVGLKVIFSRLTPFFSVDRFTKLIVNGVTTNEYQYVR